MSQIKKNNPSNTLHFKKSKKKKRKNTHKNLPNKNQSYTIFFHDYQEKSNLSINQQYSREKQKKPRKFSTKTNRILILKEPKKSKSEENPSTQIPKERKVVTCVGAVTAAVVTAGRTLAWPAFFYLTERERENFMSGLQGREKTKENPKYLGERVLCEQTKYKRFFCEEAEKPKATCCGKSSFFFSFFMFLFLLFLSL